MADDINPLISQYVMRAGQPYLSGAYIISANNGQMNFTQSTPLMGMDICNNQTITVPDSRNQKVGSLPDATLPIRSAQYAAASAPTNGIYTGVEDNC